MGLRDIGATLPPGFRFYPSDEELVCHYLYKKISSGDVLKDTLVEIDLHTCEPWQLPDVAKLNANEWYFFSFRDRKYATGFRTNRATTSGYWKATGKDRTVRDPITRTMVGMRKTLVFYKNRAPNGIKTGWIMHEFRLENPHTPPKEDWVLCRVFHKAKTDNGGGENDTRGGGGDATSPPISAIDHHDQALLIRGVYNSHHFSCYSNMPTTHHGMMAAAAAEVDRNNNNNYNGVQLCDEVIFHGGSPSINDMNRNHNVMRYNKCQEECDAAGFFLDGLNFGESGLKPEIDPSHLADMQFDDDSSLVFI